MLSHPSWVRGLKLSRKVRYCWHRAVAPLVGAWIETGFKLDVTDLLLVAPLVGAWIETCSAIRKIYKLPSHPSWVRGLKHVKQY